MHQCPFSPLCLPHTDTQTPDTHQQRPTAHFTNKKAHARDSVSLCYITSLPRGSHLADMGWIEHTPSCPLNVCVHVHSNNRERKARQRISCSCYFTRCLVLPASVGLVTRCQLISSSPFLMHWNMLMKREAFSFCVSMIRSYWAACLWCLGRTANLTSEIIL